ncbi:MAG: hypothetical protein IPK60_20705 [Sandaracinaceae bacterium]|nr:hypothetical protein [Sandaracinaceae bacterium]
MTKASIPRVTFDSNVWRIVASPSQFPREPAIEQFRHINKLISQGKIRAFLSETLFNLESIPKAQRAAFLKSAVSRFRSNLSLSGDNRVLITVEAQHNPYPPQPSFVADHVRDAISLGFKLLHCYRIATPLNPIVNQDWYCEKSEASGEPLNERFGECVRFVEEMGCGRQWLVDIATKSSNGTEPWQSGLCRLDETEGDLVSKAVAEWADGDSIAAHWAYGNDFFCTRDTGKSAGHASVLAPSNLKKLRAKFEVLVGAPEQLLSWVRDRP